MIWVEYWVQFTSAAAYCLIVWLCAKLLQKELGFDYKVRKEISWGYAVSFLPLTVLPLGVILINTLHLIKSTVPSIEFGNGWLIWLLTPFESKFFLWLMSFSCLIAYLILKFLYHFKLRKVIVARNNRILLDIEQGCAQEIENNKTPNHIEYL